MSHDASSALFLSRTTKTLPNNTFLSQTWHRFFNATVIIVCALILTSCSTTTTSTSNTPPLSKRAEVLPVDSTNVANDESIPTSSSEAQNAGDPNNLQKQAEADSSPDNNSFTKTGSGRFFNQSLAAQRPNFAVDDGGNINLQFRNTDISEVVRTVFGELLQQPYIISPNVNGRVTFSTAKPIAKDQLRYILETILSWNDAALVLREGIFHVVSIAEAVPGQLSPSVGKLPDEPGYEVQIVPLKYVSATEIQKLLKPFLTNTALLFADESRSLLILGGTQDQLNNYKRTINIFDVDWLAGMSIGIFPLEMSKPKAIIAELETLLGGDQNPAASKVRMMPMERLNSVVVMTPLPDYLKKVQVWVERLDQKAGDSVEQRLFVYPVKNMDADELSGILRGIFKSSRSSSRTENKTPQPTVERGSVAPGFTPVEVTTEGVQQPVKPPRREGDDSIALASVGESDITIIAVEQNNALLIKASPNQYRDILKAIKQLDIVPLQVLIEVNILEVTLTGALNSGVEWYLNNAASEFLEDSNVSGNGYLRLGNGGFRFLLGRDNLGIAISALESSGKTKLLSSPSLWALNNEAASINVGTQIPVTTTSIATSGSGDEIKTVQFRDTGVILSVTPRINPGGLVYLEVDLTISTPLPTEGENPAVAQRNIKTKIAVDSGQAVLLGGLISENNINSKSGVPFLSRAPVLKYFFGSTSSDEARTEIIAAITPTVIYNRANANNIMEEYQQQFQYIYPATQSDKLKGDTPAESNAETETVNSASSGT